MKWFNVTKGFGFIGPDDRSPDVFVHVNAVKKPGLNELAEGERVSYDVERGRSGKTSAENLRVG